MLKGRTTRSSNQRRGWHRHAGRIAIGALGTGALLAPVAGVLTTESPTAGAAAHAIALSPLGAPTWTVTTPSGQQFLDSSPNVGMEVNPVGRGESPSVLLGDVSGFVRAYSLASGAPIWSYPTNAPVKSTPSVAALTPGNPADSVFIGAGDAADAHPSVGGYQGINPDGTHAWTVGVNDPFGGPADGVQASLAVGTLQGVTAVTAGSLGQMQQAINASSGAVLPGFPWFQGDTSYSTPALADMYGGGSGPLDIVEGYSATTGLAYDFQYEHGGYLHIIANSGNGGAPDLNSGTLCSAHSDQAIHSSPAVGEFLGPNLVGTVMGTSNEFGGSADTDKVLAFNADCGQAWTATLDGATTSSPALADVMGDGNLQVIEGTDNGSGGGSVYVLDGATGNVLWHTSVGPVDGGVSTVNIGGGYQDVLVGTTSGAGAYLLDGKTGAIVQNVMAGVGFLNNPLVTDDPNNTIGITLAGFQGDHSVINHYEISGSNGATATETGAWPEFHHDPQLTGDAGTNVSIQVPCTAPSTTPHGYDLAASDGGMFTFGNLPFCGSTGAITLNKPVVGMALTKDAGGYWLVASDGGIFAFGDAPFYGSTGAVKLNKPIVGMAPTPDGGGYWLVASDGGIFSFGDANFWGSTGGTKLNKPIVGMAPTPSGNGYWLVASDGGIFAFGDAQFHGSTGALPLVRPVVGMASTTDGGGYWLVASDGGIFAFGDAPFYGSIGGKPLNEPVVGMQADATGLGYRFVASDGGVFDFGDAAYYGSMGGKPLNKPIVTMAGF